MDDCIFSGPPMHANCLATNAESWPTARCHSVSQICACAHTHTHTSCLTHTMMMLCTMPGTTNFSPLCVQGKTGVPHRPSTVG
jgi:hypothetical protein